MKYIGTREDVWDKVITYQSDIIARKNIADFIKSIDSSGFILCEINFSNMETNEDKLDKTYTLNEFKAFGVPKGYIDHILITCSLKGTKITMVLGPHEMLSIWRDKKSDIDFLPLLNDIEEKVRLQKKV